MGDKSKEGEGEISLRPGGAMGMSLRPGGGGGGAGMSMGMTGAGFGVKKTAVNTDETRRKKGSEVKYTRAVMMQFAEKCTQLPPELEFSSIEIVLHNEEEMLGTTAPPKKDGQAPDGRDWRSRTPLADDNKGRGGGGRKGGGREPNREKLTEGPGAHIAKAESPWMPGAVKTDDEKKVRTIKGILNKITPEKFEKLFQQLVEVGIKNVELLHETIHLVFEKAVSEPTFCALYSDLCLRLSHELPDFPPEKEGEKPMTFKRVLLNTCQEEFEGTAEARAALANTPVDEYDAAERKVRMRTLGNIRLIGELFKKRMIIEKIVHVCIAELLGAPKVDPPDENIEALCQLFTTCGQLLDASEKMGKKMMEQYFARMRQLSTTNSIPSRIRFMVKDVLELRSCDWVPRRVEETAKTLDEIHEEAARAMGIAVPQRARQPKPLNVGGGGGGGGLDYDDDENLFPKTRGGDDGWEVVGQKGKKQGGGEVSGKYSALVGTPPPTPPPRKKEAPPAPAAARPAAPAAEEKPAGPLTDEQAEKKIKSMLKEYLSAADLNEVCECVKELGDAKFHPKVVFVTLAEMLDNTKERERDMLCKVPVELQKKGVVSAEALVAGLKEHTDALEDTEIDFPLAPKLLGGFIGEAAAGGVIGLGELPGLIEAIEYVDLRRRLFAFVLGAVKAKAGEDACVKMATDAGIKADELLAGEAEDGDLREFLKSKGLDKCP